MPWDGVCVLRGRRNTLEACQCYRVVFSWQAQHFVTWRNGCFDESLCQGCANMTQCQQSWHGHHFVACFKSGGSIAKFVIFQLCIAKCCREVLEKSVVENCFRRVLERSVAQTCCGGELEKSVVEKCWGRKSW